MPSTGVIALLAGPSGTGKTLAAEVIAGDLGVEMYKIDLANMVSKYIGETEKNLSAVFDAAEAANVVLFLDEGRRRAKLGKRSEVSDAHDRYANIEVAYLLQRLELRGDRDPGHQSGASNIDPAFMRRLHVVVEFPIPGPRRTAQDLGATCLACCAAGRPTSTSTALADQFELAGGTIRNAVLARRLPGRRALAGEPITMALAVDRFLAES